jgi:hypothetical protein
MCNAVYTNIQQAVDTCADMLPLTSDVNVQELLPLTTSHTNSLY